MTSNGPFSPPLKPPDPLPAFRPLSASGSPRSGRSPSPSDRHHEVHGEHDKKRSSLTPEAWRGVLRRSGSPRTDGNRLEVNGDNGQRTEKKKKRHRFSGNFLLHPLGSKSRKRQSKGLLVDGTDEGDAGNAEAAPAANGDVLPGRRLERTPSPAMERVNGEFGDAVTPSSDLRNGKGKGKERLTPSDMSNGYSEPPGSSHSHSNRTTSSGGQRTGTYGGTSPSSTDIDPSQIVRMALTLNESRRLGLAPGQLPLGGSMNGRRAASAGLSFSGSPLINRQPPRHVSSMSPLPVTESTSRSPSQNLPVPDEARSRAASSSPAASRVSSATTPLEYDSQLRYDVSPATLLRAEKARAYFELCHEYRRLLDVLPPLKTRSSAPGSDPLGRIYNPLQYIRNRRVRARERQSIDGVVDGWADVDAVDKWINVVEIEAQDGAFADGDVALLPPFETAPHSEQLKSTSTNSSQNHPKVLRKEWKIDPADLLADAYWLEQDRNKTLIENRHGDKIFSRFSRPGRSRRSQALHRRSVDAPSVNTQFDHDAYGSPPRDEELRSPVSDASDDDDGDLQMYTSKRGEQSKKGKRGFLRKRKTHNDAEDSASDSDDKSIIEHVDYFKSGPGPDVNTGPLEKHMNMLMKKETTRKKSVDSTASVQPSSLEDRHGNHRRGGVSEEYTNDSVAKRRRSRLLNGSVDATPRSSADLSRLETPRISIDDFDREQLQGNGYALSPTTSSRKRRAFPLGFMHKRGKSKMQNMIAENDFAVDSQNDLKPGAFDFRNSLDSQRSSLASSRTNSFKSLDEAIDERRRSDTDLTRAATSPVAPKSAATRFFKGGRIGELVRNEASPKAEVVWKAPSPAQRRGSKAADERESKGLLPGRDHRRSRSTNDLTSTATSKFHIPNLPRFRSSTANTPPPEPADTSTDHISRQQAALRTQKSQRKSRFERLTPLTTQTSTEVSPNSSQVDLSRQTTSSNNLSKASTRLNNIIRSPATPRDNGGFPMTALTSQRSVSRSHRDWAVADTSPEKSQTAKVTAKEIAYVRSLLLSSGIKATSILRQANGSQSTPETAENARQTCLTATTPLSRISRREAHLVAARYLSEQLTTTTSSFESSADTFRTVTCTNLHERIAALRSTADDQLMSTVRSTADEADAFIARLTTTHTLAVKQVNDSVELSLRRRWRRLRWLRRAGFQLLEWVMVALLWGIWAGVLVVRGARGVVGVALGLLRWMVGL